MKKGTISFKFTAVLLVIALFLAIALPGLLRLNAPQAIAYNLPSPTKLLALSENYSYPVLKGLRFNPEKPLNIEFIVDSANKEDVTNQEASRLIRYFLAGLTLSQEELWVNLSPHEKDRVASDNLAITDLGKDMLGQDYVLKQFVSSLTYPESETGKKYWRKIYDRVGAIHESPAISTYNKVWITPAESVVYEKANAGFILEASLKVMHQRDYVARGHVPEVPLSEARRESVRVPGSI
ncbi:MAG: hypothetical protein GY858_09765, partial [Candidatus Omnitrophica bacterium]|nr:hypothetical protein [Candidatus Omnitrophota bacterium]